MTVMETLRADYLAARKARDTLKINLLSTLVGEATSIGKNSGQRETTDAEALSLIGKYVKRTEDTIVVLASQDTPKSVENARILSEELALLKAYLPSLMTNDELAEAVKAIITETPDANMGSVMATLKANFPGKYDAKPASGLVKEALSK